MRGQKAISVVVVLLCQFSAMTLWFSATAVAPQLAAEYAIPLTKWPLLTNSVQLGFVCGGLVSALFTLADRLDPRRFFMLSAVTGSILNSLIVLLPVDLFSIVTLRFMTGLCMAGIYPVGIKIVASWANKDMGLLVGLLVAALCLGSAAPHVFAFFGELDWRVTVMASSALALGAAFLINTTKLGPLLTPASRFDGTAVLAAWRDRGIRFANLGYLGHMWELYAMWSWLTVFLAASFKSSGMEDAAASASLVTFFALGVGGAFGCLAGGWLADRHGRVTVTTLAMLTSGGCALFVGQLFGGSVWLLCIVATVWGISVIADSAQFSASIAEISRPELTGTMLTIQTCLGFLLTLVTIQLMPKFVEQLGWTWAFSPLALGPVIGIGAMLKLRSLPAARLLAGGRR